MLWVGRPTRGSPFGQLCGPHSSTHLVPSLSSSHASHSPWPILLIPLPHGCLLLHASYAPLLYPTSSPAFVASASTRRPSLSYSPQRPMAPPATWTPPSFSPIAPRTRGGGGAAPRGRAHSVTPCASCASHPGGGAVGYEAELFDGKEPR